MRRERAFELGLQGTYRKYWSIGVDTPNGRSQGGQQRGARAIAAHEHRQTRCQQLPDVLINSVQGRFRWALVTNVRYDPDYQQFAGLTLPQIAADRIFTVEICFSEMLADEVDLWLAGGIGGVEITACQYARAKRIEIAGIDTHQIHLDDADIEWMCSQQPVDLRCPIQLV